MSVTNFESDFIQIEDSAGIIHNIQKAYVVEFCLSSDRSVGLIFLVGYEKPLEIKLDVFKEFEKNLLSTTTKKEKKENHLLKS